MLFEVDLNIKCKRHHQKHWPKLKGNKYQMHDEREVQWYKNARSQLFYSNLKLWICNYIYRGMLYYDFRLLSNHTCICRLNTQPIPFRITNNTITSAPLSERVNHYVGQMSLVNTPFLEISVFFIPISHYTIWSYISKYMHLLDINYYS